MTLFHAWQEGYTQVSVVGDHQRSMRCMQGATGSGMLRLGGLSAPHRDGFPGGRDSGVETAASMQLRPTRERWKGPVDLDAAVAARADEMNATWVASAGDWPPLSTGGHPSMPPPQGTT